MFIWHVSIFSVLFRFSAMNSRPHKQSMSELKLRRLNEHIQRLRDDLARPRIRVSEASARYFWPFTQTLFLANRAPVPHSLINYCKITKDHLVRCFHSHVSLRSSNNAFFCLFRFLLYGGLWEKAKIPTRRQLKDATVSLCEDLPLTFDLPPRVTVAIPF